MEIWNKIKWNKKNLMTKVLECFHGNVKTKKNLVNQKYFAIRFHSKSFTLNLINFFI